MPRRIEPEWLDELPPDDPRAVRSRRDLRRINMLMRNSAIVAREVSRAWRSRSICSIAEIGAGDGMFMLKLARNTAAQLPRARVVLLDRQSIVDTATLAELGTLGWQAQPASADVFEWLAQPAAPVFDVLIANLFLHHFDEARLKALLALVAQRTYRFIACEPRRSTFALVASHLLGVIGCNDVTRHDAVVSVHAGFERRELSALWPSGRGWNLHEGARRLFSHCFVASSPRYADERAAADEL